MLTPQEAAGGPVERLVEIPLDARVDRLQRRVAALERQLEARIDEVEGLRQRVDEQAQLAQEARQDAARARAEADVLRPKAVEYEALMGTLTMRVLRRPREMYAWARRRLSRP